MADELLPDGDRTERKPLKKGFAKIDVVDVILSDDTFESRQARPNILEQLTEQALRKKNSNPDAFKNLYEPSYRQEPKRKFDADVVVKILEDVLEKELRELSYSEKECSNACKRVAYHVRKAVKALYYDRYRIVCQVRIIEKVNQGLETRIGFLWDNNCDAFASHYMETHSFAAYAVVYGVYKE